jgi:hypothetical protein
MKTNRRTFLKGAVVGLGTLMVSPLSLLKAKPIEDKSIIDVAELDNKGDCSEEILNLDYSQASDGSSLFFTKESLRLNVSGSHYQALAYLPKSWDMSRGRFEYEVYHSRRGTTLVIKDFPIFPMVNEIEEKGIYSFMIKNEWRDEKSEDHLLGLKVIYRRESMANKVARKMAKIVDDSFFKRINDLY